MVERVRGVRPSLAVQSRQLRELLDIAPPVGEAEIIDDFPVDPLEDLERARAVIAALDAAES